MTRARTYRSGRPGLMQTVAVTASAFGLALATTLTVASAAPASVAAFNPSSVTLSLSRVSTGLSAPVGIANARDGSGRLFVVEQAGRIRIVKGSTVLATPFLDIHSGVSCCGERGLLGLAFHPSYRTNGKFYVNYTDVNGNTVIAEYHRSTTSANRASTRGRVLMRVTQPYANHNGGGLAFGPDGVLYIGLGDGGSGGDPGNRAQRRCRMPSRVAIPMSGGTAMTRSGRSGFATHGASRSTGPMGTCGSATSGKTASRRSIVRGVAQEAAAA